VTLERTTVEGAYLVRLRRFEDDRGFFARTWSPEALREHGLDARLAHTSVAWNRRAGTLRGMHYQAAPFEEAKLVSCPRGVIFDVVVDLRRRSATYLTWHGVRLDGVALEMLYVPPGCAHGYLTLTDDVLVQYAISERHSPEHARGVRWDDPSLGIVWPAVPSVIAERDRHWPLLAEGTP